VKRYLTSEPSFHTLHLSFTLHPCVLCSLCYTSLAKLNLSALRGARSASTRKRKDTGAYAAYLEVVDSDDDEFEQPELQETAEPEQAKKDGTARASPKPQDDAAETGLQPGPDGKCRRTSKRHQQVLLSLKDSVSCLLSES
jgi:hypothetical protein